MRRFNVEGSWPALVTPLTREDNVDTECLKKLVDFHIENGSDGLLLLGSTGEAIMLSKSERKKVIEIVVDVANGKIPVMCGTSAITTKETIENTRHAKDAGVDGALLVQPAYVKPTQEALYQYFKDVAESIDLPITIYNNPARTGVNIEAETVAKLSHIDNIVALKEAGSNPYQVMRVIELTRGKFNVLCCDCPSYALILPTLAAGGNGTSNVTGSIVPREFAELSKPWKTFEDALKTRELYLKLLPLMRMMYAETNPVPLKAALNMIGANVGHPRKPLIELSKSYMGTLKLTLKRLGILEENSYQRKFFSKK